MRAIMASSAALRSHTIHVALRSFADECSGVLARLIAYVGALALIAIVAVGLCDQLELGAGSTANRSERRTGPPRMPDSLDTAETYEPPPRGDEWRRQVSLLGLRGGL
jgi:hypothetical protein